MHSPLKFSVIFQLVYALAAVLFILPINNILAYSFGLGVLVYAIPNVYFTAYAFRYTGRNATKWVLKSFQWGESGKLTLAAIGFALVFVFVAPLDVPIFFLGFVSTILIQLVIAEKIAKKIDQRHKTEKETNNTTEPSKDSFKAVNN